MRPILFLWLVMLATPCAAQYAIPLYNTQGLYNAVQQGDAEGVRRMIAHGVDANFRTEPPLLVTATLKGYTEVVAALLEGGAKPDVKDNDTRTALVYAAREGRTQIAALLLAKGADPNARNDYPHRYLQLEGRSPHLFPDNQVSALMYAAKGGYTAIVDALAARGAKVNAEAYYGETALMFAAAGGHTRAVSRLLELGADLHASADNSDRAREAQAFGALYGGTPLLYAARAKQGEAARALLAKYGRHAIEKPKEVYYYALFTGDVALMEALAARGIDPPDDMALGAAAQSASADVLAFVVERRRKAGLPLPASVLVNAAQSGSVDKVKALVKLGANVNARDNRGQNALFYAVYTGAPEVVAYLLDQGAEANVAGGSLGYSGMGETALAMAVQKGDIAVVKLLLAKGANPRFKGAEMSALEVATKLGRTDMVMLMTGPGQPSAAALKDKSTYREMGPLAFGTQFRSGGLLFATMCATCHGRGGSGLEAVMDNGLRVQGWPLKRPTREVALAAILSGVTKPNTIPMEGFSDRLLDAEAAAILTYIDSATSSSTQATFQPGDVERARRSPPTRVQEPLLSADRSAAGIVKQLADLGYLYSESVFVEAVRARDQKAVELFLAAGMSPAARDARGHTALFVAAFTDNVEAMKALLDRGAPPTLANSPWANALPAAAGAVENCRGRSGALRLMLDRGLDPNYRMGLIPWTLLMSTAKNGCVEATQLLIDRGADVNARLPGNGTTALQLSKSYGASAVAPALIKAGARE